MCAVFLLTLLAWKNLAILLGSKFYSQMSANGKSEIIVITSFYC